MFAFQPVATDCRACVRLLQQRMLLAASVAYAATFARYGKQFGLCLLLVPQLAGPLKE